MTRELRHGCAVEPLTTYVRGRITVVEVSPQAAESSTRENPLEETFAGLKTSDVVVDLSQVRLMSALTHGKLVKLHKDLTARGGRVVLAPVSEAAMTDLKRIRLVPRLLPTAWTVDDAVTLLERQEGRLPTPLYPDSVSATPPSRSWSTRLLRWLWVDK